VGRKGVAGSYIIVAAVADIGLAGGGSAEMNIVPCGGRLPASTPLNTARETPR